jgi:prepilin-type processing-associated H-X9-DG protein
VFEPAKPDPANSRSVPNVFWCPEDKENHTDTNYVMLIGPHAISNGPNSVRLKDITDGDSRTIAVVETYDLGIRWYEPRDLRVDEMSFKINDRDHYSIASRHPYGGAHVGFVDGHTEFLTDDTDPRVVEVLATINGGEEVSETMRR